MHQLADALTKQMKGENLLKVLHSGQWCLTQSQAEQKEEVHRADLRRGQRQRKKERATTEKEEKAILKEFEKYKERSQPK